MNISAKGRFWDKVDKSGDCWEWIAARDPDGYGAFRLAGKQARAHRVSWELERGPIPSGMHVLHKCDNPPCVNPNHLFLGTNKDNSDDKVAKGRAASGDQNGSRRRPERRPRGDSHYSRIKPECLPRGMRNGSAKLTDDQVREIREHYASGAWSMKRGGELYGVSNTVICEIVNRRIWRHVD